MHKNIYPGLQDDPVLKGFLTKQITSVQEKTQDLSNSVNMSVQYSVIAKYNKQYMQDLFVCLVKYVQHFKQQSFKNTYVYVHAPVYTFITRLCT